MPNDDTKFSLLSQLTMDYDSSDSEKSSIPSPPHEALLSDPENRSSLQIKHEQVYFLASPVTGSVLDQQTENVVEPWNPPVNFLTPSIPESKPMSETNPFPQTVSPSPFQTSALHLDQAPDTLNQFNFSMNSTLSTSLSHGQNIAIPSSSSSLEQKHISFADDAFTTSDLYSDLMMIDSDIYADPLITESTFQSSINRDVDPAQHPVTHFSYLHQHQESTMAQDRFFRTTLNTVNANQGNNNVEYKNPTNMDSAFIESSDVEVVTSFKDVNIASHNPSKNYPDDALELKNSLERSRQEVEALSKKIRKLKNDFEALNKKYQETKKESIKFHESKKMYKHLAEQRETELKFYKEQNNALISDEKTQLTKIAELTETVRQLEERRKEMGQSQDRGPTLQVLRARDELHREALCKEFESYKKKILHDLQNQQEHIFSLLRHIKIRGKSFEESWRQRELAPDASHQDTMPYNQERSFTISTTNTTRAKIAANSVEIR